MLIPLYAIGVFTGFTLSQAGLVVHWRRARSARCTTTSTRSCCGTERRDDVIIARAALPPHCADE